MIYLAVDLDPKIINKENKPYKEEEIQVNSYRIEIVVMMEANQWIHMTLQFQNQISQ